MRSLRKRPWVKSVSFGGATFKPAASGNQPAFGASTPTAASTPMAAKSVAKGAAVAVSEEIERVKGLLTGQYQNLEKKPTEALTNQGAVTEALTKRAEKTERGVQEMFVVLQQKMEALNKTMDARVDDSETDWRHEMNALDELLRELENFKWRMEETKKQADDEMVEKLKESFGDDGEGLKAIAKVQAMMDQMEAKRQAGEIERMEQQIAKARIDITRAEKRHRDQTEAQRELKVFTTVLGKGISGFQHQLIESQESAEEQSMDFEQAELDTPEEKRDEVEMEIASVTSPESGTGDEGSENGSPAKKQKSEDTVDLSQEDTGQKLDFDMSVEPEATGPSAKQYMESLQNYKDLMAIANHDEKQSMENHAETMQSTRGEYRMDDEVMVLAVNKLIKRVTETAEARLIKENGESMKKKAEEANASDEQKVTEVEKEATVVAQKKETTTVELAKATMTQPKIDAAMGVSPTGVAVGSRKKVSTKIGDSRKGSGGGGSGNHGGSQGGSGSGEAQKSSGGSSKGQRRAAGRDGNKSSGSDREMRSSRDGTPSKRTRESTETGAGTPSTELGKAVGQMKVASPPVKTDTMEASTGAH